MTDNTMSPAEVMAKAVYDLWRSKLRDGEETLPWEECEDEQKAETIGEMRAALRALAQMEPTEGMLSHANMEASSDYDGSWCIHSNKAFANAFRATLLAAAEEGEQSKPALRGGGAWRSEAAQ